VNEPVENEPKSDFGQPKAEFNAPASAVAEPAQKIETFYQKKAKAETRPAFETKQKLKLQN
jgi:cell division protein FtsZ